MEQIKTLAPNYLVEKCLGEAAYLPEYELAASGECPVELEFSPYHQERPGFSVFYTFQKLWKPIATIEDIYTIVVENNEVVFEMRTQMEGFKVRIDDRLQLESFVSCITVYYR